MKSKEDTVDKNQYVKLYHNIVQKKEGREYEKFSSNSINPKLLNTSNQSSKIKNTENGKQKIRKNKWSHSIVSDSATQWTIACQAPPSMEFSSQEY